MKKLITSAVLVGFIGATLFSIFSMNHGFVTSSDCPLLSIHTSVCPTDGLSVITHYLSMYQVFTNGIVSLAVTQVLMTALLFVAVAHVLRKHTSLIRRLLILFALVLSRNFGAKLYLPQAFIRWLALLVNSPSLI